MQNIALVGFQHITDIFIYAGAVPPLGKELPSLFIDIAAGSETALSVPFNCSGMSARFFTQAVILEYASDSS